MVPSKRGEERYYDPKDADVVWARLSRDGHGGRRARPGRKPNRAIGRPGPRTNRARASAAGKPAPPSAPGTDRRDAPRPEDTPHSPAAAMRAAEIVEAASNREKVEYLLNLTHDEVRHLLLGAGAKAVGVTAHDLDMLDKTERAINAVPLN